MEWLKGITDLIGVLIWPSVLIWFLATYRTSMQKLLRRLSSAEIAGNKLAFGQEQKKLESEVDAAREEVAESIRIEEEQNSKQSEHEAAAEGGKLPTKEGEGQVHSHISDARDLTVYDQSGAMLADPTGIVVRQWNVLQKAVERLYLASIAPNESKRWLSVGKMIDSLREVLPPAVNNAFVSIRLMRNRVVHEGLEISLGEALAYANSVQEVVKIVTIIAEAFERKHGSGR